MTRTSVTIFILLLCLTSCLQRKKDNARIITPTSIAQRQIQYLVDTFKVVVGQEKDLNSQDSIRNKFAYKFYDLLSSIYIDSIRVHIDSVVINNLTVTTAFHSNNEISFKYSLTFLKKMNSSQDTLFKFLKGLKVGVDTMVNFAYMGNQEVRLPNTDGIPIIKIFAFPTPIWLPKKD